MHLRFRSESADRTERLGEALAAMLRAGDVLALHGPLGAGKTCLVRGLAHGLGLDTRAVSSPTFVVMNEYREPGSGAAYSGRAPGGDEPASGGTSRDVVLVHVDAYRLGGSEDLDSVGWERAADGASIVVVEWAERIAGALEEMPSVADLTIEPSGESSRVLVLRAPASWWARAGWSAVTALAEAMAPGSAMADGWSRCRVTGEPVPPDGPWFPFASERAKLADLNRWFTESNTISRPLSADDFEEGSGEEPGPGG